MKKWMAFILTLVWLLGVSGCNSQTMDTPIENMHSITGIVKEVQDNFMIMDINTEGYPNGASCKVSLDVESEDSYTEISVGDEVVVYYNGEIAESYPLQINTVYTITLKTLADQQVE